MIMIMILRIDCLRDFLRIILDRFKFMQIYFYFYVND